MIVSFSGIDSAGKTTQIKLVEEYCTAHNISYRKIWAKARGTPGIILLKSLIRRDKKLNFEQQLVYREKIYESRYKQRLLLIASLLDLLWYFGIYYRILGTKYRLLILDRYLWDTYVEVKCEFDKVDFEKWALWRMLAKISPIPSISILYTIPAEESIKRDIEKNDLTVDSIDQKKEKIKFYEQLVERGKWSDVIDGMHTIEEVHRRTMAAINCYKWSA